MQKKQKLLTSFLTATNGLKTAFKKHRNLQVMGVVALAVIALGIFIHLIRFEWAIIILCIALVLGLELLNSALEETLDHLHPQFHKNVGNAKDIAAGAVLLASIGAAIAGLFIFIPKLFF